MTLKHAMLCERVITDPLGIRSILNIATGVEASLPTTLQYSLVLWWSGTPESSTQFSLEVRGPLGTVLSFGSGALPVGSSGESEIALPLDPVHVAEPGPYAFVLVFDKTEVWRWTIHVARKAGGSGANPTR